MFQLNIIKIYTLSGIAFGLAFPLVAWTLDIILSDLTLSPAAIVQIHQHNFMHYIIDLAPFVLGIVFYFLGKTSQQIQAKSDLSGPQLKPKLLEIIRSGYFLVGIILAVLIWPFDAVIDIYIFGDTITFWQEVFNSSIREVYVRSIISVSLIAIGFFISVSIFKNKWAHEQIKLNEEKATLLLNSTGEGIYGIDLNGECTFANNACLDVLGYKSEQELIGKNMHELIHHTHNDGTPCPVEECKIFQAFHEGEGTHIENEVLWRKDGSSFDSEYRSFPMCLNGEVIGSVVSFTNISTRVEAEKKEQKRLDSLVRFKDAMAEIVKFTETIEEAVSIESTQNGILKILSNALDVERVSIWFYDDDRSSIVAKSLYRKTENVYESGLELPAKDYPDYFKALAEGIVIAADDAETDPRTCEFKDGYLKPLGITSLMDVPIKIRGETMGVICHEHIGEMRQWDYLEQEFATSVSISLALVLESHARLKSNMLSRKTIEATTSFLKGEKPLDIFTNILENILELTASEYGFIGDVLYDESGAPYLKSRAITNIAWDQASRELYRPEGMEFRNLDTLFGHVMTTKTRVLSNSPADDERAGGIPQGHPPLNSFLGIPLMRGEDIIGMLCVANRPGGYDEAILNFIEPFTNVCAYILWGMQLNEEKNALEERLLSFFNVSQEGILFHEQGIITDVNLEAAELTGYDPDEMVGLNVLNLIAPESREVVVEKMANNTMESYEIRGLRKDGSKIHAELSKIHHEISGRVQTVVSFRDITERKALEHDRNRSREMLMAVVEGTASVTGTDFFRSMVRHLASAFGVQYAFVTECIETGGSRVRSLAFWHINHFADTFEYDVDNTPCKQVTMEGCPAYYASGIQELFPEDQDLVDLGVDSYLGLPIFNTSKAVIGHVVLLNPTSIEEATLVDSVLSIFVARAGAELERLQVENEREQVAAELAQLIDTANAPIFSIDTQGKLTEWNQAAAKLTGYKKDDVMGRNLVQDFITEEYKQSVKEVLDKALQGDETANYEFPLYTNEGKRLEILLNATARRDTNGNITGVIGIGQDITELRQKENALQQAQKMEAVGQLTGGIAHDFNNLLSIISGNLRFLQQDMSETNVEIDELFEDAMSAADDGAELTQRLLAFSRNRALKPELKNVNDTIEKSVRFLSRTLAAGVELDIVLPDENLYINVDPSQLENALLNLSINARDAMPEGGTITISAERYYHGDGDGDGIVLPVGDYVQVSVTDTGIGITTEDLLRVYEPFFTTKEVGKGSGLGLSMVYGFVQQSNGTCHISSTPGEGTTVSMYFPEVMDNKTIEKPKDEKEEQLQASKLILVVEDEPRVRRVTLRDLQKMGYKTLEAENADMAKTIIESGEPIDLLFSDVLMPGDMDGHMLGVWTEENYPQIRVVLTSGYTKDKADVSSGKSQPFPLIRKPYSIDKLAKQIRTTLVEYEEPSV